MSQKTTDSTEDSPLSKPESRTNAPLVIGKTSLLIAIILLMVSLCAMVFGLIQKPEESLITLTQSPLPANLQPESVYEFGIEVTNDLALPIKVIGVDWCWGSNSILRSGETNLTIAPGSSKRVDLELQTSKAGSFSQQVHAYVRTQKSLIKKEIEVSGIVSEAD